MSRLAGKVIVITGSTTGIGEALARRSVAEGARVLLHGLEEDLGAKVLADLGSSARLCIADLVDPRTPGRLVQQALEEFGRLDAVVNNAAWVPRSTITTTSVEVFDRVIAINTRAPLLLIQAAIEPLQRTGGAVLNIGSVNAWCGEETLLAYSISKGGLMTMTRNLGDALFRTHGIRVNQVNPGWVLTPLEHEKQLANGNPTDWHERIGPWLAPTGRLITPDQLAAGCIYWISDESAPISGSVVELAQFPVIGRNPPKTVP